MAQKLVLIGQSNFYIAIQYNWLAAQPRIDARVYRPVDKILFLVRNFLDIIHAFIDIYMAGAASANAAAIML